MKNMISRQDMILATKRMNEDFNEIWETLLEIVQNKEDAYTIANLIQSGLEKLEETVDDADWNILNNNKAVM